MGNPYSLLEPPPRQILRQFPSRPTAHRSAWFDVAVVQPCGRRAPPAATGNRITRRWPRSNRSRLAGAVDPDVTGRRDASALMAPWDVTPSHMRWLGMAEAEPPCITQFALDVSIPRLPASPQMGPRAEGDVIRIRPVAPNVAAGAPAFPGLLQEPDQLLPHFVDNVSPGTARPQQAARHLPAKKRPSAARIPASIIAARTLARAEPGFDFAWAIAISASSAKRSSQSATSSGV